MHTSVMRLGISVSLSMQLVPSKDYIKRHSSILHVAVSHELNDAFGIIPQPFLKTGN
jgi:hypothetical protein